ncbi:Os03g0166401 [Oryza sativa Japonica Group]|uniref:Os03g0166401 protein n=1 Tax=Oryza sativa subsp. japonica TaxID=39947 RepID=C7J0N0_ORYSJ|nr:Os03g0166401 [Oryza sativa Japonica Group]|eukprot:NP_001173280.1 Os03g0166401 [Oryza sativa Japonica Group]
MVTTGRPSATERKTASRRVRWLEAKSTPPRPPVLGGIGAGAGAAPRKTTQTPSAPNARRSHGIGRSAPTAMRTQARRKPTGNHATARGAASDLRR